MRRRFYGSFLAIALTAAVAVGAAGAASSAVAAPPATPVIIPPAGLQECLPVGDPTSCPGNDVALRSLSFSAEAAAGTTLHYEFTGRDGQKVGSVPASATGETKLPSWLATEGINEVSVTAANANGERSDEASYAFMVSRLVPQGWWKLDELSGTTAANSGHISAPLTLGPAPQWSTRGRLDGAIRFDGSGYGPATADASALDVTQSFTVAAWVRLDKEATLATVFSAPGQTVSSMSVGYDHNTKKWYAGRYPVDGASTKQSVSALAARPTGVWTHVAATYDRNTNTTRLFVNGRPQGSVKHTKAPWAGTALWVGCDKWNARPFHCLRGSVDEVRTYQLVLPASYIKAFADPQVDSNPVATPAGRWRMEDAAASTTAADEVFADPLTLTGLQGEAFSDGALTLGPDGAASAGTTRSVVDSTGSFSVRIDAALTDLTKPQVIARQAGANADAWSLSFVPSDDGGKWRFSRAVSDSATAAVDTLEMRASEAGSVTSLVVTYSAATGLIHLYENARPASEGGVIKTLKVGSPWATTGGITLGAGTLAGSPAPMSGTIHDFVLYAGELSANAIVDAAG